MRDGYPESHEHEKIINWKMKPDPDHYDWSELMEYVQSLWHWGSDQYEIRETTCLDRPIREYIFHTGGWSGNESLIAALRENMMFWMMCWYQSTAGGHFIFRVRLES